MTTALEGGEWSAARPGRTLPPGKTQYPFYRRLGGPQGRSGRAENLVPTGIRSRTVQPVAQSLYRLSYPAHHTTTTTTTTTTNNNNNNNNNTLAPAILIDVTISEPSLFTACIISLFPTALHWCPVTIFTNTWM